MRGHISRTMTRAERVAQHEYNRRRYLPSQIDAARRKVLALENEALRYGMTELLTNTAHLDRAWDIAPCEDNVLRGKFAKVRAA